MRLSQSALAKHTVTGGPTAAATIDELRRILADENVSRVMATLYPNVESSSIGPNAQSHGLELLPSRFIH
jgi:hypothetical protein